MDLIDEGMVLGLESPAFRGREAFVGKLERGQIGKCFAGPLEPLLQACSERPEQGGVWRFRPDGRDGVTQQRGALAVGRRSAPRRNQKMRFTLGQGMAFGRAKDLFLTSLAQRTEGVGERWADGSPVHSPLDLRREVGSQRESSYDPGLAPVEQLRDRRQTEVILLVQRTDDARLVHRSGGARRSIGSQQQKLALGHATAGFDHRRHPCEPLFLPAREPFEAVDDFVAALPVGHDADRQILDHRLDRLEPCIVRAAQQVKTGAQLRQEQACDRRLGVFRTGRRHRLRCGRHGSLL